MSIDKPISEVFDFFSDARNLEYLTPDFLHFKVETPEPIVMQAGLLIDYSLRLHGIPFRWQSEISVWEPGVRFVDRQTKGPYNYWIHEHSFVEKDGATLVRDAVQYGVPGGALVERFFVRPDLYKIFLYRTERIVSYFSQTSVNVVEGGSTSAGEQSTGRGVGV